MSYMSKANNRRSARFDQELRIVEVLRKRIAEGEGWARIKMKSDGAELDISYTVDKKYLVTFPPYYDAAKRNAPYKALNEWFGGLDEVAEFILNNGWRQRW